MLKNLLISLIVLTLISPAQAALLKDDTPKIIVSGKGIVKAKADVAYVTLGVERTEKTATEAQDIAARKMKNILASLNKIEIPKDKIETTMFRVFPKYEYDRGKSRFVGYTASNQIKITLDDLNIIGKTIDTAIAAGANNVRNVSFSIEDPAPQKREALQKAFKDAKEKAEAISAASGLVLKKIRRIQEAGAEIIAPPRGIQAFSTEGLGRGGAETPIAPGKIEIRGSLSVVYECAKK